MTENKSKRPKQPLNNEFWSLLFFWIFTQFGSLCVLNIIFGRPVNILDCKHGRVQLMEVCKIWISDYPHTLQSLPGRPTANLGSIVLIDTVFELFIWDACPKTVSLPISFIVPRLTRQQNRKFLHRVVKLL